MSSHSEPYANAFGILAGIVILWIGTLAVFFAVKALYPATAGQGEDGEDEESRGAVQRIDIASVKSREAFRSLTANHAIAPSDLPGLPKS